MQHLPFAILKFSVLTSCCFLSITAPSQNALAIASGHLNGQSTYAEDKPSKSVGNGLLAYFSAKQGKKVKADLFYKIQIGAYQFPESFNYKSVVGMPKLIRELGKDQLTRFSMGNFASFNQAQELLRLAHANGLKDAFVAAIYKGERKTIEELIIEKILEE